MAWIKSRKRPNPLKRPPERAGLDKTDPRLAIVLIL
jgi:hypothetical protein